MELLILKSGEDYIRFKDGTDMRVGLEKASVFSMDQMDVVQTHRSRLVTHGLPDVCIKKLVLSEEEL